MTASQKRRIRESLEAYGYLAPSLLILTTFWFLPIFVSFAMSFGNITALKPLDQMDFVGLEQYRAALGQRQFRQTLWNTVNYVLYSVPITLTLSLCAALLLNQKIRARGFFRTAYFLPYITTWVAIAIVFRYLFHREYGLGNWLLGVISTDLAGLDHAWRLEWLSEPRGIWELILGKTFEERFFGIHNLWKGPSLALFTIALTSVWRDTGYFMVIFLAGLQNIDKSLYEAASIDGANAFQRFRHITFPLLSPVSFFLLIISMITSFKVFVPQFMMTPQGGPDNTTMPMVMYLYREGFLGEWKLSYAAAVAYILTLIILTLTLLQNRFLGKKVEYGQ
jgi:multiple sugar transport system permease protein